MTGRGKLGYVGANEQSDATKTQNTSTEERRSRPEMARRMFGVPRRAGRRWRGWRIRALISEGNFPNSHTIARVLEWSLRTVKRDLALMKNQLTLPMEFDQEKNGWHFTKPV